MGRSKHYKRGSRFSWREVEMAFGIYFWRLHKVAKVQRQLKSRALHLARSLFVFFFFFVLRISCIFSAASAMCEIGSSHVRMRSAESANFRFTSPVMSKILQILQILQILLLRVCVGSFVRRPFPAFPPINYYWTF